MSRKYILLYSIFVYINKVPGQQPRVTYTPGLKAIMAQQQAVNQAAQNAAAAANIAAQNAAAAAAAQTAAATAAAQSVASKVTYFKCLIEK